MVGWMNEEGKEWMNEYEEWVEWYWHVKNWIIFEEKHVSTSLSPPNIYFSSFLDEFAKLQKATLSRESTYFGEI